MKPSSTEGMDSPSPFSLPLITRPGRQHYSAIHWPSLRLDLNRRQLFTSEFVGCFGIIKHPQQSVISYFTFQALPWFSPSVICLPTFLSCEVPEWRHETVRLKFSASVLPITSPPGISECSSLKPSWFLGGSPPDLPFAAVLKQTSHFKNPSSHDIL